MKCFFFFMLLLLQSTSFAQNVSWTFEIPEVKPKDTVIVHTAISLLYSEKHEQAAWVAYQLLGANTYESLARSNRFTSDPKVKTGTATTQDYLKSGFDRGHLAPAADFTWSAEAMNESFYYSNMSPQLPGFNRGIWKRLETQVRNWSRIDSCIYIVTGPILENNLETIGPNLVSVPKYYYKVVVDYYSKSPKGIGFVIPNESSSSSLMDYVKPIEEIEQLTGINFFPQLSIEEVQILEKQICVSCWNWSSVVVLKNDLNEIEIEELKPEVEEEKQPLNQAVQCVGITKAGSRCKNKTKSINQRCHLHLK